MGWPVLAQSDGIMRHHIDHTESRQSAQTACSLGISDENKKGCAKGNISAICRNSIANGSHGMFSHTIGQIATCAVVSELIGACHGGQGRTCQITRTTDKLRNGFRKAVDRKL
eukprot:Lithocolla_globosa_v1_NODE_1935_length_2253_cov_223.785259.p2 type:complete len:113 gc:universal NODE_1935_length_2253_cov_223.785259:763-1101(+)